MMSPRNRKILATNVHCMNRSTLQYGSVSYHLKVSGIQKFSDFHSYHLCQYATGLGNKLF